MIFMIDFQSRRVNAMNLLNHRPVSDETESLQKSSYCALRNISDGNDDGAQDRKLKAREAGAGSVVPKLLHEFHD